MAEEAGGLASLTKVVPSIYYDLIARVCAGVPFMAVLLWDKRSEFGEVSWSKLALLLGAGYLVGLVLTPLSLPWWAVQLVVRRIVKPNRWCTFKPGEINEYEKVRECMAELVAEGSLISKSGAFQLSEAGYTKYVHRIRALRTLNTTGVKSERSE